MVIPMPYIYVLAQVNLINTRSDMLATSIISDLYVKTVNKQ